MFLTSFKLLNYQEILLLQSNKNQITALQKATYINNLKCLSKSQKIKDVLYH